VIRINLVVLKKFASFNYSPYSMTLAQSMAITFNTFIDGDTTVLIGCSHVTMITFTTN